MGTPEQNAADAEALLLRLVEARRFLAEFRALRDDRLVDAYDGGNGMSTPDIERMWLTIADRLVNENRATADELANIGVSRSSIWSAIRARNVPRKRRQPGGTAPQDGDLFTDAEGS